MWKSNLILVWVVAYTVAGCAGHSGAAGEAPTHPVPVQTTLPAEVEPWAGELTVLEVLSPTCSACKQTAADLDRLARKPTFRDVRFVGLVMEADQQTADRMRREHRISFEYIADPSGLRASRFPVRGVPSVFVLDRQGQIAWRSSSGVVEPHRIIAQLKGLISSEN